MTEHVEHRPDPDELTDDELDTVAGGVNITNNHLSPMVTITNNHRVAPEIPGLEFQVPELWPDP